MDTNENRASHGQSARDLTTNRTEQHSSIPNDLPDSKHDEERLHSDETIINLPDVSDIPGQENIQVPPFGEIADTTISSADEEGDEWLDDENDDNLKIVMGTAADVNNNEHRALADDNYMPTRDEDNLRNATMGSTDFQGEGLNEKSFGDERSGIDLDIPQRVGETRTDAASQDEENDSNDLEGADDDNAINGTP